MYVLAKTTFMHGRTRFEVDSCYDLPEMLAGYLIGVGWALPVVELPKGAKAFTPKISELLPEAPVVPRVAETLEVEDAHIGIGDMGIIDVEELLKKGG